jgi:hypothetical protein
VELRHIEHNGFSGQEHAGFEGMEPRPDNFQAHGMEHRHVQDHGFPNQGQRHELHAGQGRGFNETEQQTGSANDEAAPPLPPPRNYGSHYRSEFHSKQKHHHEWKQSQQHQGDVVGSFHHSLSDHGASNASNSQTNLSQDMDGSLLDLADELGDRGRISSTSLHSGSSRRSQTDLGVASGYQRDGNYSVSRMIVAQALLLILVLVHDIIGNRKG